MQLIRASVT